MGWIQSKIPDMPITNFTNDWNDGRAIGALVDGVAPGTTRISRFCLFDFV
jgi:filamin